MTNSTSQWVGASVARKQDLRLVTGHGRYTDDISLPGMLHAAMLRSPHAHARIKSIDVSRARALHGVHAVLTGEDAKRYWGPLPPTIDIGMKVPMVYGLATEKVYYMGEPVVAVAAETRYLAEDALELIDIEYEPLAAVTDTEAALAPDAPLLYPEWGDNVQCEWGMTVGALDETFANADHVFEYRLPQHRYSGASLEARAALAHFDAYNRKLTLYCSTQSPNLVRTLVAQTFRFPEHDVQVIAPDIGGGYGNKLQADAEVIPCLLSLATGQPVKWTESRQENLLSGMQCRDYVWYLKVAVNRDGILRGLDAQVYGNVGCDGTCHAAGAGQVPGRRGLRAGAVQVAGVPCRDQGRSFKQGAERSVSRLRQGHCELSTRSGDESHGGSARAHSRGVSATEFRRQGRVPVSADLGPYIRQR